MSGLAIIDGLIIDNFAGGGGASTGIEAAIGRSVDVAINHDPEAVALHKANHPGTEHYCQSVWKADPQEVVSEVALRLAQGERMGVPIDPVTRLPKVALAWFSPDCKHFSKAKGGKPVEKGIRDLAWVVVQWAQRVRPAVIMLENVEEFQTWGPIAEDGRPDPAQKGKTFTKWVGQLRRLGYRVQWKELRACDYGAPTSRKRLFLIARSDKLAIVWPKATHGKPGTPGVAAGKLLPWRTAASIIDWSIPCPSIFERTRPLKDATCRRIAAGIKRYVLDAAKPFIVGTAFVNTRAARIFDEADPLRTVTSQNEFGLVAPFIAPLTHHGPADRGYSPDTPLPTVTGAHRGELAMVSPVIIGCGGRRGQSGPVDPDGPYPTTTAKADACVVAAFMEKFSENSRGKSAESPIDTVMAGAPRHGVVAVHMAQFNTNPNGSVNAGHDVREPISTIATKGPHQAVVASSIVKLRGTSKDGQPSDVPLHTVSAGGLHHAEVRAFMVKYYGAAAHGQEMGRPFDTVTSKARFGLVTVDVEGEPYAIVDIGMRMLSPRELYAAQGFPSSYIIDPIVAGKPLTKTAQIRMCGNSVCPPMSEALVRANFAAAVVEQVAA